MNLSTIVISRAPPSSYRERGRHHHIASGGVISQSKRHHRHIASGGLRLELSPDRSPSSPPADIFDSNLVDPPSLTTRVIFLSKPNILVTSDRRSPPPPAAIFESDLTEESIVALSNKPSEWCLLSFCDLQSPLLVEIGLREETSDEEILWRIFLLPFSHWRRFLLCF